MGAKNVRWLFAVEAAALHAGDHRATGVPVALGRLGAVDPHPGVVGKGGIAALLLSDGVAVVVTALMQARGSLARNRSILDGRRSNGCGRAGQSRNLRADRR